MLQDYRELQNEIKMLEGNICRMCLTNDKDELFRMIDYALKRIDLIFEYNENRLNQK